MAGSDKPLAEQLAALDRLALRSVGRWPIPDGASARLINVSENATYLVEWSDGKAVLRVHRAGYHTRRAIECELAWSAALDREGGVPTPAVVPARNGQRILDGQVPELGETRHMVLFEFVEGTQPDEQSDLAAAFGELGAIAARTHQHSANWARPQPFERLIWGLESIFGPAPNWGQWRDAPHVTDEVRLILERVQATIIRRLQAFGADAERYGLIHADMRLANLLISPAGETRLIDFDDCGLGWFLYDFATGVSFIEDHPQVPTLKEAWVEGYRQVRTLSPAEEREIDSFVMLRRLALLAWIGSHIEAPEPQQLAPDFARVSAELGERYLTRLG
jgi:Ser/Thr protein kinase RdoA (MazF antagonist)